MQHWIFLFKNSEAMIRAQTQIQLAKTLPLTLVIHGIDMKFQYLLLIAF